MQSIHGTVVDKPEADRTLQTALNRMIDHAHQSMNDPEPLGDVLRKLPLPGAPSDERVLYAESVNGITAMVVQRSYTGVTGQAAQAVSIEVRCATGTFGEQGDNEDAEPHLCGRTYYVFPDSGQAVIDRQIAKARRWMRALALAGELVRQNHECRVDVCLAAGDTISAEVESRVRQRRGACERNIWTLIVDITGADSEAQYMGLIEYPARQLCRWTMDWTARRVAIWMNGERQVAAYRVRTGTKEEL
jgi:hypothetical protein